VDMDERQRGNDTGVDNNVHRWNLAQRLWFLLSAEN